MGERGRKPNGRANNSHNHREARLQPEGLADNIRKTQRNLQKKHGRPRLQPEGRANNSRENKNETPAKTTWKSKANNHRRMQTDPQIVGKRSCSQRNAQASTAKNRDTWARRHDRRLSQTPAERNGRRDTEKKTLQGLNAAAQNCRSRRNPSS